jgi:hypothetical protein
MVYGSFLHIPTFFLDLFTNMRIKESIKDLEIVILRQQVRILQRKVKTHPQISDPERMILTTLANKLCQFSEDARQNLQQVLLIFKPDTVLGWHRNLIRRKWSFKRKGKPGRPGLSRELEVLIMRLAKENLRWSYDKGSELLRLGRS